MSIPEEFYISEEDSQLSPVDMGKRPVYDLYHVLSAWLEKTKSPFRDEFEGCFLCENFHIEHLDVPAFISAHSVILQACDEIESLKPYKAALKAALEADPRYRQAKAA